MFRALCVLYGDVMGFFFKPVQGKTTDSVKCSYESMKSMSSADVEKMYSHVILI